MRNKLGYRTISELLAFVPGMVGVWARRVWYRLTLAHCGKRLFVDWMAVLFRPQTEVGDDIFIGSFSWVGLATIGDGTMISGGARVLSGRRQHGIRRGLPMHRQMGVLERVVIGRDCWVGAGAIVTADLAEGTVVGAGSVVVKATEAWSVVAGNPAQKIGERPQ